MTEPLLGWRIWNLRRGWLESWAVDYRWRPGDNVARCLAPRTACDSAPGRHCQCGFWAMWAPAGCLPRAVVAREPPWHVMGLVAGWGTVALHGDEGFRAEVAAVRCLFTDRPWSAATTGDVPSRARLWCRRVLRLSAPPPGPSGAGEPAPWDELTAAAARYGVPAVSLRAAAALGLLDELGVPGDQVEAAARLAAGAAAPRG